MLLPVPLLAPSLFWIHVFVIGFYYALLATSWNLLFGYTGIVSLGHVAFASLGVYWGMFMAAPPGGYHGGPSIGLGVPAFLAMPMGGAVAALVGLGLGALTLRMRGVYLALTTLGFSEIVRSILLREADYTRGALGIEVLPLSPGLGEIAPDVYVGLHYYLGFALLYGVILATYLLIRSRVGFYLRAIRDDPEAAEAMGVDTVRWKLFAFTASAFIAGVAGAFYGQYVSSVTPSLGVISEMGLVVAMTVIGGAGTILGPVLGGLLVQGASQYLREYEALRLILFGLFIIMIMRFFPSGLMGVLGLLSRRLTLLRVSLGARVGLGGPPLSSSGRSTGHPRWAFRRRNKTGLRDAANH